MLVASPWHAMTLVAPPTHMHSPPPPRPCQLASLCAPPLLLRVPFNLPAVVYIVCMTIRVLLAAIMKGTVLICCFLSLLLSQATAGKGFLVRRYDAGFCVVRCGNDIYLCATAADG